MSAVFVLFTLIAATDLRWPEKWNPTLKTSDLLNQSRKIRPENLDLLGVAKKLKVSG